jgi:hypothetical protein
VRPAGRYEQGQQLGVQVQRRVARPAESYEIVQSRRTLEQLHVVPVVPDGLAQRPLRHSMAPQQS